MLSKLRKIYGENLGVLETEELLQIAKERGIDKKLKLDVSLVRGLDYYTGPLFEIYLGERVGCGGGGRYDKLIKDVGGQDTPATGISLGISRIFEVMTERNMFSKLEKPNVFIANVTGDIAQNIKVKVETIKLSNKLRKRKINCEMNITNRDLADQLKYASNRKIRFVIIVGKNEIESGKFKLKDMDAKTEEELELEKLVRKIKSSKTS
jgi:histidyl-tRNA synthetase